MWEVSAPAEVVKRLSAHLNAASRGTVSSGFLYRLLLLSLLSSCSFCDVWPIQSRYTQRNGASRCFPSAGCSVGCTWVGWRVGVAQKGLLALCPRWAAEKKRRDQTCTVIADQLDWWWRNLLFFKKMFLAPLRWHFVSQLKLELKHGR